MEGTLFRFHITLLQKQLFKELVSLFGLCLGSLLSLILIGRMLQLRELFLGLDLNALDMATLFVYLSPLFLTLIIPIACMLSVFLAFLRMSTDRELVALKAGGLSLFQLLPAPLLFCLLCGLLNLYISLSGVAWGMGNFRHTIMEIANTRAKIVLQPGVFNQTVPGLTVFARTVDNSSGKLGHVLVEDNSRDETSILILAPRGQLRSDEQRGELVFILHNGKIYRQQEDSVSVLDFNDYTVRLDLGQIFKGVSLGKVKPKELSWSELRSIGPDHPEARRDSNFLRKVHVELQKRWVLPMACLVLGLFAMPLACAFQGLDKQFGILLALGMFLIYYTLLSVGLSTGESGTVPPAVGLWMPNLIFLAVGLFWLDRAERERSLNIMSFILHANLFRKKRAQ
ncbi:LPS export ABC transporter permease LptF [Oleidesulfovibrio alaskensis]